MYTLLLLLIGFFAGRTFEKLQPRLTFINGVQLRYRGAGGITHVVPLYTQK